MITRRGCLGKLFWFDLDNFETSEQLSTWHFMRKYGSNINNNVKLQEF